MFTAFLFQLASVSNATAASRSMQSFIDPIIGTMCVLSGLGCTFFLVRGGYGYITSNGNPEKLHDAKIIIRNALLGLVVVFGAVALAALLMHAYGNVQQSASHGTVPILSTVKPQPAGNGLADVLIKAITGMLQAIIQALASPFLSALNYFTAMTPLMAVNTSVFGLWLTIVGIADALFILVVALLGFHLMSYATFGLEEIEFKHMLPQIGATFLLVNTSIFAIDGIISLSNAMIHVLKTVHPLTSVWDTLSSVATQSGGLGLATLLIMIAFFIFTVMLLIYYVGRLVTLYIGAVLSPLLILLWLIPSFRDFVETAAKIYVSTIFVLFIHVVILQLAASIFAGLLINSPTHTADPVMAMIVGLATVVALLKTQGVLTQLSYASIGPRSARRLGGLFVNSFSFISARPPEFAREFAHSPAQLSFFQERSNQAVLPTFASHTPPQRVNNKPTAADLKFDPGKQNQEKDKK